jgi:orotidine-5'-phosphate decarboxylase
MRHVDGKDVHGSRDFSRIFMPDHFADRLATAVRRAKTPTLVGLDPRVESLPKGLLEPARSHDPAAVAEAYRTFCRGVIDVVAPLVPAVKPQVAFFEEVGPQGMIALGDVIRYAASKGLLVIVDGKRNDIGSTATAYAHAWLGAGETSPWGGDALTVSPYLGDDSLDPFVEVCIQRAAGVFVLVKTSNPGGKTFQDRTIEGAPLYQHVAEYVEGVAQRTTGACGYSCVGAVVGATYPQQLAELRTTMQRCWFLVPGFGTQGGSARDVAGAFDEQGLGGIVNNSRGIIFAHSRKEYKDAFGDARWQGAVEAATRDMIAQLAADTSAGKLASASAS